MKNYSFSFKAGFTLAEVLIALAVIGVASAITINMLLNQDRTNTWGRVAEDYFHHISAIYNQYDLQYGQPLINTSNTTGIYAILPTWESIATYSAVSPESLTYPSGVVVYMKPEQVSGITNPILSGTDNREWLMLDMNGSQGPNSLSTGGDRVMIYIENTSGRVLTGWQKSNGVPFTQSFYDTYKGF